MSILELRGVHARYGKSHILRGIDLALEPGQTVSILGRNGSGRSTILKTIMGLVPPSAGSIRMDDAELAGQLPHRVARAGIAYVPEERLVFKNLTVDENLRIGVIKRGAESRVWMREEMYDFFPRLKERRRTLAGSLSGGEQQMLTICRSLLGNPRVILIDEPTEGLAPLIVDVVVRIIEEMQRRALAVVLVEQKLTIALKIASAVYVIGHGQVVFSGSPDELKARNDVRRDWLEVS